MIRADSFAIFSDYCRNFDPPATPMPAHPETVAKFATTLANSGRYKASSIQFHLNNIRAYHIERGFANPVDDSVKAVMRGIRRTLGTPLRQASPLTLDLMAQLIAATPPRGRGKRDRALFATLFWAGLRISEALSLELPDVAFHFKSGDDPAIATPIAVTLTIRSSKTDVFAVGQSIYLPAISQIDGASEEALVTCPVVALFQWATAMRDAGIDEGRVFRGMDRVDRISTPGMTTVAVHYIIKDYVERIGLDPKLYSSHSFRAGVRTSGFIAGATHQDAMRLLRHTNLTMSLAYNRLSGDEHQARHAAVVARSFTVNHDAMPARTTRTVSANKLEHANV